MQFKDRNTGTSLNEISIIQKTIQKANQASLASVLSSYSLSVDQFNKVIRCPFSFHQGGRESSGSFNYYSETNSFYCFGCKTGGGTVEFVAKMQDVTSYLAATRIIEKHEILGEAKIETLANQHFKLCLEFSHLIREFIGKNPEEKALLFAEENCKIFDQLRFKHIINENGMQLIFDKLKGKLTNYV